MTQVRVRAGRALRLALDLFLVLSLGFTAGACSNAHSDTGDTGSDPRVDSGALADGAVPTDGALAVDGGTPLVDGDGGGIDAGISALVGTPCETDADCPGLLCSPLSTGFGYCTWLCGDAMPCPGDAVCARFDPEASYGYCMPRCDPGGEPCPMGNRCQAGVAEVPVCYPGCSTDLDCGARRRCGFGAGGTRQCYTVLAMAGQPCELSTECPEAGYCLDEAGWGTPSGLCTTFCDLTTLEGCDASTVCVAWGFMSGAGACIPLCDGDTPCRTGYQCVSTGVGRPTACVPRCASDADCTGGRTCSFVTGTCG